MQDSGPEAEGPAKATLTRVCKGTNKGELPALGLFDAYGDVVMSVPPLLAQVEIQYWDSNRLSDLQALIDTGGSWSFIPSSVFSSLGTEASEDCLTFSSVSKGHLSCSVATLTILAQGFPCLALHFEIISLDHYTLILRHGWFADVQPAFNWAFGQVLPPAGLDAELFGTSSEESPEAGEWEPGPCGMGEGGDAPEQCKLNQAAHHAATHGAGPLRSNHIQLEAASICL